MLRYYLYFHYSAMVEQLLNNWSSDHFTVTNCIGYYWATLENLSNSVHSKTSIYYISNSKHGKRKLQIIAEFLNVLIF